jgi:NADH-quinone oxidoreductase subunit J
MALTTLDIVLLVMLVVSAIATVVTARLLVAALGLAFTSVVLAIIMFRMDATLAAVFELSICAGLIPVIFISSIGLTQRLSSEALAARRKEKLRLFWALPAVVILVGLALMQANIPLDSVKTVAAAEQDVRAVLWNVRHVDLIGQVVILLAAAFAVAVLLKRREND